MTQREKLLQKFSTYPESLHYSDICKILKWCGLYEIKGKGSHVLFKNELETICVIPIHNNDCKPFYKRKMLRILLDKKLFILKK